MRRRDWTAENVRRSLILLLLLLAFASGCRPARLDETYGRRRGTPGEASVNGTAVLAHLFESAGHRVVTWRRLSPKLDQFQTIVWFPNDFAPPTQEQRRFLERWLSDGTGRTLIYVGRDYDASIDYWKSIQPLAPPGQAFEVARRLALARAIHERQRATIPDGECFDWFVVRRDAPNEAIKSLGGPWAENLDATKAALHVVARFDHPTSSEIEKWMSDRDPQGVHFETLLAMNEKPVVSRITYDEWLDGQIIVVANGSFLLNLPLVNAEHRQLAQQLIGVCDETGRTAFLESDRGGPTVYEHEPGESAPTGFEVFTVWPLGVILVHLTALGFLACVALFPIFGRPRELPLTSSADFGQHVDALGELLEKAGDREHAMQRLRTYHEHVRRDTGGNPAKS